MISHFYGREGLEVSQEPGLLDFSMADCLAPRTLPSSSSSSSLTLSPTSMFAAYLAFALLVVHQNKFWTWMPCCQSSHLILNNKLPSLEATLVWNHKSKSHRLTSVECRATSVAKNHTNPIKMIKTSCNPSLIICFQSGRIVLNLSRLLENHPDNFETLWTVLRYSRLQRNCSDSVRTCNYHNQNLLMRKQIPGRNAYGPLLHVMSTHIFPFQNCWEFSNVDSPVNYCMLTKLWQARVE